MKLKDDSCAATEVAGSTPISCKNNTIKRKQRIHKRCLVHKSLPCSGNRQYQLDRVICSGCCPHGISLDRLPEFTQEKILREMLYV